MFHWSQWPCGLRRGSAAASLLGLQVWIPPEAWMSVCYECCVWSGRGLCIWQITHPLEPYWVWCVWVWLWSLDDEEGVAHWGLLCHGGRGEERHKQIRGGGKKHVPQVWPVFHKLVFHSVNACRIVYTAIFQSGVWFLAGARDSLFLQNIQIGSGI